MSNISYDLSEKIDKQSIKALLTLQSAANSLNLPMFLIGALARDLLLEHCHNIKSLRKTTDVDIGVKVANWSDFNQLIEILNKETTFSPDQIKPHRFYLHSMPIDIVPFG